MHHLSSLFSNVLSRSKISFQIPSECTNYRPCFPFFCISKSFEIMSQCTLYHPCFHYFICFAVVLFFYRSTFVGSAWSFGFFIPATTVNDLRPPALEASTIPLGYRGGGIAAVSFKYHQSACFKVIFFICSSK